MNHEPKINRVIGLMLLFFTLSIDVLGMILAIAGLDDFFILDVLSWPTIFYFTIKGVRNFNDKFATIGEFVPYLGALPLKTFGVFLVLLEDRNPNSRLVALANNTIGKLSVKKTVPSVGKN